MSITAFTQIYSILIQAAGTQAGVLRRCLQLMLLAAILQGLAFCTFYPLLFALLERDGSLILTWLAVMTVLMLASIVARWFAQDYDYAGHCALAGHELRTQLGEKLKTIPMQTLYQKRSGELNAILAGNVDEVMNYTVMVSMMLINTVFTPLTVAMVSLWIDWRVGLLLLLLFAAIMPIYHWVRPLLTYGKQQLANANSELNAELIEYTQGLPVLKASNNIGKHNQRLKQAINNTEQCQKQAMISETLPNFLLGSAVEIAILILLAVGILWVEGGSLSATVLTAVMLISIRFAEPLSTLLSMLGMYELIQEGYRRLSELQALKPLPISSPITQPKGSDIEFKDVTFCYQGATHAAIDKLSVHIPQHGMTALVGASGCGKTTLIRLLMRYGDPQLGSVHIGGIDIRQIEADSLMSLVSVVFQDVYLFDDSIERNIRMGNENATFAQVVDAAKGAQCHDFIESLPQGYQTKVGEIGGRLSGGERQRISIARALLKDAPIVILDEPTAALDTESEVAVQTAIDTLVQHKTVIVIAHRLSTIIGAHNIVVMQEGKVLEQGTHQQLLTQQGQYYKLWQLQHGANAASV